MKYRIALIFILLPYIGVGIVPSDIQPFAVLFSFATLLIMFLNHGKLKIPYAVVPFILIAILSASFYIAYSMYKLYDYIDMTRSLFAYITPVLIILYIYNIKNNININYIVKSCDYVIIVTIIGFVMNIIGLTNVIQLFVNRSSFVELSQSARGFTGFYPEQSRISEQMSIIFSIYLIYGQLNKKRLTLIIIISLLSFAGQLFVQLGVILLSYSILKIIKIIKQNKISNNYLISIGMIMIILINVTNIKDFAQNNKLPTRGIVALESFLQRGTKAFSNDDGVIIKSSGLLYSISSLIEYPLNFSFSSKLNEEKEMLINERTFKIQKKIFNNDRPYVSTRVNSALGILVVDYGLFGLIMIIIILYTLLSRAFRSRDMSIQWVSLILVFMMFIKIPMTNPSLWLLYSLLIFNVGKNN